MKRHVHVAALALAAFAPLVAQSPQGWKVRADRSTSASDPDGAGQIKFVTMGSGYHATNPQAAVYWNPANTVSGNYTLKGTFTLMKPSGHNNYYGLVFGGNGLEGPQQSYLYFLIAQDGTWLTPHKSSDVPGGFGFHAGLLQEAEIAEPVDEAVLPGAKRDVVAVRQTAGHAAAVAQGVAGVAAVAVNVHLDIRHAGASIAAKYSIAQTA